jgi:hypothetical protein
MLISKKSKKQMIKLVEVVENRGQYNLREIILNSAHIISMTSDNFSAGLHANGKLPEGLHEAQQFSTVSLINGKEITVVGSPDILGQKVKNVLHG